MDVLDVGLIFPDLFNAPVHVAQVRDHLQDVLAIKSQHQAQHPVGAGMLGPHVEKILVRKAIAGGRPDKTGGPHRGRGARCVFNRGAG